jgi:NitT/TauT family transport system ATP-binding protein
MPELVASISKKRYPGVGDAPPHTALEDVVVAVAAGEFVAIVGPSGCGKTTFLNIVAGLDREFEGELRLAPQADGRPPRIGYVFQNVRLLPWRTVHENIALVLRPHQDRAIVDDLLDEMGLREAREVFPSRLSVGMSRRVAIARAFAIEPDLLLMDEPFSSLDAATADRLRELLIETLKARPTSVLFVTHDLREAVSLADRILLLSSAPGRVLGEVPIGIPRERRGDPRVIEALHAEVTRKQRSAMARSATGPG